MGEAGNEVVLNLTFYQTFLFVFCFPQVHHCMLSRTNCPILLLTYMPRVSFRQVRDNVARPRARPPRTLARPPRTTTRLALFAPARKLARPRARPSVPPARHTLRNDKGRAGTLHGTQCFLFKKIKGG
jgi:hypothetical protein